MKIWIVNQYALPPSQPGGTRHHSLSYELIGRGHDVTLFTSNFSYLTHAEITDLKGALTQREIIDEVPYQWVSTPPYRGNAIGRMRNMISFGRRIRKIGMQLVRSGKLPKPDVILGSNPQLFGVWGAQRLAKSLKVPFVFEVRDLWPQTLIDLGSISPSHPLVWFMSRLEKHLYDKASRIVSLLPGAVDYIAGRGVSPQKITWIPNGVDLRTVPDIQASASKDNSLTVMYAGAHGIPNGLDTLLDAAALLKQKSNCPEIRFRFIGEGKEKPRLIEKAAQAGLTNVVFEPPVPKNEIHAELTEADCLVLTLLDSPLYRFGMSLNKLFDYLAVARPIVFGANVQCNPVADASAGVVIPPQNAEAMAEAILQIARLSPAERWEMGQRGRKYVEENHDFRRLADRLETTFQDVVSKQAAHRVATTP